LEEKGVVNIKEERKIDTNYSFDREKMANFLARIASEIAKGRLIIKGEEIKVPMKLDVEYEYKFKEGQNKIEIELKWND
jgi:amphi-Trp domain-containing protein